MRPTFSIIIPVLHEENHINLLIKELLSQFQNYSHEIIVVDGDGRNTIDCIDNKSIITLTAPTGRAHQMNAASEAAQGDILLFLHADTHLPDQAPSKIIAVLENKEIVGGAFKLKIDSNNLFLKCVAWISSQRSQITRTPYGDQSIFLRRDYFFEIGKFNPLPVMEEVDLMQQIKKQNGKIQIIDAYSVTSARRWEREGTYFGTFRNLFILSLYYLGISPQKFKKLYPVRSHKNSIIFFIKYPLAGKVKTRLAKNLPEEQVVELYKCFVRDLLETLKKISVELRIYFSSEIVKKKFQDWLGESYHLYPQCGKDLGERMSRAFHETFKIGFRKVLIVGSDSPDLTKEIVENAFAALDTNDTVIGPTKDGGYYLLGFRKGELTSNIFKEIEWSTNTVFEKTIDRLKQKKRKIYILPTLRDIDTITDLHLFVAKNKDSDFKESHTMQFLEKIEIPSA